MTERRHGPWTRALRKWRGQEAEDRYYDGIRVAAEVERFVAEQRRVAADHARRPHLDVRFDCPGRWAWTVTARDDCKLDSGHGETWAEAIAVGLAALEVASIQPIA